VTNEKKPQPNVEYRSLGATLAAAALTGTTAGTANALANQAINVIRKPKDDLPDKKS
jgi:hypothetical protein